MDTPVVTTIVSVMDPVEWEELQDSLHLTM